MRSKAAVSGKNELSLGKPVQNHRQQLPHQFGRRLVAPTVFLVPFRAAVQSHQHGQRPGTTGKGELHQDCQHNPLVSPAIRRIGVRRTYRVPMTGLAVDFLAAMSIDRVVADQRHSPLGKPLMKNPSRQCPSEFPPRPAATREDAMVTGGMPWSDRLHGSQNIVYRMLPNGENGGEQQEDKSLQRGPGKCGRQFLGDVFERFGYTGHGSILARSLRIVWRQPMIPRRPLPFLYQNRS